MVAFLASIAPFIVSPWIVRRPLMLVGLYTPYFVEGHEPEQMHQRMAATLESVIADIHRL
jgi:hypothetical protein